MPFMKTHELSPSAHYEKKKERNRRQYQYIHTTDPKNQYSEEGLDGGFPIRMSKVQKSLVNMKHVCSGAVKVD
jgi:hypothetical protein